MSDTASVLAICLNAVFGNLTAPIKLAFCSIYSLTLLSFLSSVNLLVIKATIPPGFTLSRVFSKK